MIDRDAPARARQLSRRVGAGDVQVALHGPSCALDSSVYAVCAQVRPMRARILIYAAALLAACGSSTAQPSVEQSIAKAVTIEGAQQKDAEIIEAKAREERQRKANEKQGVEQARAAEIDAAAVLPATLPADLAAACDAVVDAHDAFMKRGPENDVLNYYQGGRRKKIAERRAACVTQGKIPVAACEAQALTAELPSLTGIERSEAALMVMARCAEKFGAS